jgi:hypothetical protein
MSIKLKNLINPLLILKESTEKELPEEITVSERGYEYLTMEIEKLNKKAEKYQVPPIQLEIIGTEFVYVLRPQYKNVGGIQLATNPGTEDANNPYMMPVKKYKLRILGEPPKIEGYEFIARLEHANKGNFIYTNPKASVSNLPPEFKSMNQHCDVCKTNRDRNDTFVIKMLEDDPKRFPDKEAGDLMMVGRNCLARFLPGITINGLIMWTKMVDAVTDLINQSDEFPEDDGYDGEGGGGYNKHAYEDRKTLLKFLIGTYLFTGRYVSKKQAQADFDAGKNGVSTMERALGEMHPHKFTPQDAPIYFKLKDDEEFQSRVNALSEEFLNWIPTKDFDKMAAEKPNFADFFHNLKLVSGEEYIKSKHNGFFGALFQLFIRDKGDIEEKKQSALAIAEKPESPVQFGENLIKQRLRNIANDAKVEQLRASGKGDKEIKKMIRGHKFGWNVVVKKISEYEKTNTFGYGDSPVGYRMFFEDEFGNEFLWFAGTDLDMIEGNKYSIDGTITGYEQANKYSGRPQVRINRVNIVKDYQEPDVPITPVTPQA